MQAQQIMFKKMLEYTSLRLPPFAPFRTLFTDKMRTVCVADYVSGVAHHRRICRRNLWRAG
jgi:hypothetical protein